MTQVQEDAILTRITVNPDVFGGKPIIRGHRLAVEHVLGMLAAGDTADDLLREYPWLERDDVQACLVYAKRLVAPRLKKRATQSSASLTGLPIQATRSFSPTPRPTDRWS